MTNESLALSYLTKVQARLRTLPVLMDSSDFSDVVREAQEIVELALKAMLRHRGIEPPKWHDVGPLVLAHGARFPELPGDALGRLAAASHWLREERETCFYGDSDFIPTDEYGREEAQRAAGAAESAVEAARLVISGGTNRDEEKGRREEKP